MTSQVTQVRSSRQVIEDKYVKNNKYNSFTLMYESVRDCPKLSIDIRNVDLNKVCKFSEAKVYPLTSISTVM